MKRSTLARAAEAGLSIAVSAIGLATMIVVVLRTSGPGDPSVCAGFGPSCHVAPGLSPLGAIANVVAGSLIPAAIGLGGWLDARHDESAGAAILVFGTVFWAAIAFLTFGAGGAVFFPTVAVAVMAVGACAARHAVSTHSADRSSR